MGATAIGLAPYQVGCKNRTTGQRVVKKLDANFVDFKNLGLHINAGDDIQVRIRGIAEQ